MHVERLLQINIATLTVVSTFMLAMGHENAVLPLGMLAAAMLSVWLTDATGKFVVSPMWGKVASVVALALFVPGMFNLDRVTLITGVGGFLVILQIIHLFQRKDPKTYFLLMEFSLLQVVVAALLSQGFYFGLLVIFFLFTALSALFLLFLHRERLAYQAIDGNSAAALRPLNAEQASSALTSEESSTGARWPLIGQAPSFTCPKSSRIPVHGEMFVRLIKMGFAILMLSVLVFFTIPRRGHGAWRAGGGGVQSSVGFSNKVALGQLGRIIENPEEVLRVSFQDAAENSYPVRSEVYLRGAVMTVYENGEWKMDSRPASFWGTPENLPPTAARTPPVRQKVVIEPMADGQQELFCVWPFTLQEQKNPHLYYDSSLQRLMRRVESTQERLQYELDTRGFENGLQIPLVSSTERGYGWPDRRGFFPMPSEYLQLPGRSGRITVPALAALAAEWLPDANDRDSDRYNRAQLLERMLRDSGRFRYSLEGQPRDESIDPIEDFIRNNPRGHCEYFATALVLMLRSRGIPARLVIGYRSEEWNKVGEPFLQVRQLHAHAWAEAYLRKEEIPEEYRNRNPMQWQFGGWLRLDPTPGSEDAGQHFWTRGPGKYFDWLNFAWNNYVMEMDRPRQRSAIYNPLSKFVHTAFSLDAWRSGLARLREWIGLGRWFHWGGHWFSWQAFLVILFGGTTAVLGLFGWRGLAGRWRRSQGRGHAAAWRREGMKVEFYHRLETLLARHGLVRPAAQTQREFARVAGQKLATRCGDVALASLTTELAEAFYRVRFGQDVLDKTQVEAVEQALKRLERAEEPKGRTVPE